MLYESFRTLLGEKSSIQLCSLKVMRVCVNFINSQLLGKWTHTQYFRYPWESVIIIFCLVVQEIKIIFYNVILHPVFNKFANDWHTFCLSNANVLRWLQVTGASSYCWNKIFHNIERKGKLFSFWYIDGRMFSVPFFNHR